MFAKLSSDSAHYCSSPSLRTAAFYLFTCVDVMHCADNHNSVFIKRAVSELRQAITQQSARKWILYSAHNSTILAVMRMLGAPMDHIPPYASDLNFPLFAANPALK